MNKDQVKGTAEQAKGKVQELAGKAVGNKNLEAKGDANQVAGKIRGAVGDTKEQIKRTK
ncbi:MAG: CsbD family protein [Betaproteobacteria bacterium]